MADNQSRAKTNPFPHHNHSSIMMNNNSAPYNSPQQHQHQGGLSLSLSFPQHAADAAPSPILLPLGPFTGYATILNTSRFLTPAQSILDDLFAFVNSHHTHHHEAEEEEASLGSELKSLGERVSDHRWNKSNLMLMLHEVHRRYNLCCDQMKTVVTSFEAVAGLGNAAPFISNAIRIVSVHFTSLKNALLHRIHTQSGCCRDHNEHQQSDSHNHNMKPSSSTRFNLNFFLQSPPPPPPQQRMPQHPVWRSQRVLPDRAVALLKSWLFEHFLHPYPTDAEKQILAQQTGLSRTQVRYS
ncbi:BEL1-like homeodomain protein 9 [Linum perenne]